MRAAPGSPHSPRISLIRADALVASPWKNGGGVTREIAAEPPGASLDTFAWRVSVADVAQPGPFSRFSGIDRTLVLLSGAGMTLAGEDGSRTRLAAPLERIDFDGALALSAELHDGATRDFNLMTRRSVVTGRVSVLAGDATLEADARMRTLLLFCASGAPVVSIAGGAPIALGALDTLRVDLEPDAGGAPLRCTTHGTGALLAIELLPTAAAPAA